MTDAIIEAARRALHDALGASAPQAYRHLDIIFEDATHQTRTAIRAAALEEAAKVAENQPSAPLKIGAPQTWIKQQIAAAIRALKADAPPPSADSA